MVPLIYLFAGWLVGKTAWDLKAAASWVLTRVAIPVVIIFNIYTRFGSMSTIIVATALFGDQAATIVIAAYVGSSIVGNSVGAGMLSGHHFRLLKLVQTPPVLALIVGAALFPFGQQVSLWFDTLYEVAKLLMSFLGMALLGVWLSKTELTLKDLRHEIRPYLIKSAAMLMISLMIELARIVDFRLITENTPTLYLFCLLPPAANIIVLETHYLGTGRSARIITCGTCISIIAMSLFAAAITIGKTMGIVF